MKLILIIFTISSKAHFKDLVHEGTLWSLYLKVDLGLSR